MPLHDFECPAGHRFEHYEQSWRQMPKHPPCPTCQQPAEMVFVGKWNGIHTEHSGMYGRYEPCFGEVVHSYSHKKQLLKEFGAIESKDPVKGSRSFQKEEGWQKRPATDAAWSSDLPTTLEE